MDESAKARELEEQIARTRRLWELNYGHRREHWPHLLREPYELAHDELGMPSQAPGHRWNAWRRLTGDEDYFATCSCGWRGTDTGHVIPTLEQVRNHLDAVRAIRGWRPAPRTTRTSAGDEPDAGQRTMRPDERARELYASVANQQRRLSQALEDSADLLSASEDQADRFVAALEYTASRVVPEWAKTRESAQRAQALQRQAERAKELRDRIVAAAAALAAIAEEVALAGQDLKPAALAGPPGISP
jgi:hypothetical protein